MHKSNWYNRCLPEIRDITPVLDKIAKKVKAIQGVNHVYIWGSYAKNIKKPSFRIKDIDIITETDFHSEDLIAIDDTIIKESKTTEDLQDEGFDPLVVNFSKKLASLKFPLLDSWAISKDHKLIHWGPICASKEEEQIIKNDAENFANEHSSIKIGKMQSASNKHCYNWYTNFHSYYLQQSSDMPSGWYASDEQDIDSLLQNAIKLV